MRSNNLVPRLCGFLSSLVLTSAVILITAHTKQYYATTIQIVSGVIFIFWLVALIMARGWKEYRKAEIAGVVILCLTLGLFFTSIWYQGYLTNDPMTAIGSGTEGLHRDTLYHNALASSIDYYGKPSLLVNSDSFHNYHFGSHYLFGMLSRFLGIPTIYTYCYIYPLLFLPLFVFLILSLGSAVRKKKRISLPELILVLGFFMFILLPREWSDELGNWKSSWICSESFCMATVFSLLFIRLWIALSDTKIYANRFVRIPFLGMIVPLCIFIISTTKISVGMTLACAIAYFLFRNKRHSFGWILVEAIYLLVVLAVYYIPSLFYSPINSGTAEGNTGITLFHFLKKYVDGPLWGLHVLVIFSFSLLLFVYRLKDYHTFRKLKEGILKKELVLEEILFLTCIVGALPGLLIEIGGGSAFYFFSIQQIIAVVLLLKYHVPDRIYVRTKEFITKFRINRLIIGIVLFCLCFNLLNQIQTFKSDFFYDCIWRSEFDYQTGDPDGYLRMVHEINEITDGRKEDYCIFVTESSMLWSRFKDPDCALFFFPALTGVLCIGELYTENGKVYLNSGRKKVGGYGYQPDSEVERLTEESAYQKAGELGKKIIIYVYDKSFRMQTIE